MKIGERRVNIVKAKLSSGIVKRYVYVNGLRVDLDPADPNFENLIASMRLPRRGRYGRLERERIEADLMAEAERSRTVQRCVAKLVVNARSRAARKKLDCDITREALTETIRRQRFKCAVSGLPFDFTANVIGTYSRNPFAPSLDRVESKLGYLASNVRVVLSAVNYGLNEWGLDQYVEISRAVAARHPLAK